MAIFMLTCAFAGFCGLAGCVPGQGDQTVRARLDTGLMFAEFWTSAEPGVDPWPAILQSTGLAHEVWVLFSPGTFHGHWMMTVVPATREALLTHQYVAFGSDIRSARGTCAIDGDTI
jgi:hypothetical protein